MKQLLLTRFLCLVAITGAFSCNTATTDDSKIDANTKTSDFSLPAVKDSIKASNDLFVASIVKGDSASFSNIYTSDGKIMAPNSPAITGTDGIKGFAGEIFRTGIKNIKLETSDVWGTEEMVIEEGTYTMGDDKGKTLDKGKYISVWKKENGKWKLFRDISNSDMPVSGSH